MTASATPENYTTLTDATPIIAAFSMSSSPKIATTVGTPSDISDGQKTPLHTLVAGGPRRGDPRYLAAQN
jgi:hypothetical protein